MELQACIDKLDVSQNPGKFNTFLDNAQAEVTFWGGRIIRVNGVEGFVSLNDVVERVFQAKAQFEKNGSGDMLKHTATMFKKLAQLTETTETAIKNASLLRRIISFFRELFYESFTPSADLWRAS